MIAIIDGVTVMGNPDEIKRYKDIVNGSKTTTSTNPYFDIPKDNTPEHTKKYKHHDGWSGSGSCDAYFKGWQIWNGYPGIK